MNNRLDFIVASSIALLTSAGLILSMVAIPAVAQAPLPGGTYTQNFDTLANTGTSSTTPTGWTFLEAGNNANTTYTAGTGSSNTGDTYSYGPAGSTDRAFGELSSANLVSTLGVQFQNQTGSTVGSLSIQYTCEQWRRGSTAADALTFQYSTDATALNNGTWTALAGLNCSTVTTAGNNTALNGNLPANRATINATITGLTIVNNSTFWLRWSGADASGNDDGLAIDDFSLQMFTPTAITLQSLSANGTSHSLVVLALVSSLIVACSLILLRRRSRVA